MTQFFFFPHSRLVLLILGEPAHSFWHMVLIREFCVLLHALVLRTLRQRVEKLEKDDFVANSQFRPILTFRQGNSEVLQYVPGVSAESDGREVGEGEQLLARLNEKE